MHVPRAGEITARRARTPGQGRRLDPYLHHTIMSAATDNPVEA
ncbi:hypothetical protein [Actinocrinis puniceicyclus]|nr:hypothetical protein [Actinocrinis puniceicyclus]